MTTSEHVTGAQLADLAELVETGPVDLGAYTQAELAVVLGQTPALAGLESDVLAEAVRSLAARGLLFRAPGSEAVEIVGDLGLVLALFENRTGVLDIRRGHQAPAHEPWRWLVSLVPHNLAIVDRVDALGLHRLSLISNEDLTDEIVERLLGGNAVVLSDLRTAIPVAEAVLREVTEQAEVRWQIIYRVVRSAQVMLELDALLLRTGPKRVDLITAVAEDDSDGGYQRIAVDKTVLQDYLLSLTNLR